MKLIVKKYCLSYGGRLYKTDDVLEVPDGDAANILAITNGDVTVLADTPTLGASVPQATIKATPVAEPETDVPIEGLPDIDPAAAIADTKKAKKK